MAYQKSNQYTAVRHSEDSHDKHRHNTNITLDFNITSSFTSTLSLIIGLQKIVNERKADSELILKLNADIQRKRFRAMRLTIRPDRLLGLGLGVGSET